VRPSPEGTGPHPPAATSGGSSSRPHRAARLEYAFDSRLAAFLQRRGWTSRVEAYVGYGAPGWALGRVVLAGPGVRDDDLDPGWHDVELVTTDGRTATVPVIVIGAATRFGVVSDIDDTVMVTRLPRPFIAAWNTFVRHENAREPVPGMADFYRRAFQARDGVPVMYLSTGAWNAAPAIGRFLRRHHYPTGPLLLTDWGPTNSGWFRSGAEHKRAALRRLLTELPGVRWVLVGDDGQRDPQIYAEIVQEHPERVLAVAIRQLSGAEQVLAHGAPAPWAGTADAEARTLHEGVPLLQGADGAALLREWTSRGVSLV